MKDQDKTREELVAELQEMREKIAELEISLLTLKQQGEVGREAETTWKTMIEAFDGLIYMCSPLYEVEFMNERFIQRTGHNPVGEKCYRALHDLDEICPWCVNGKVQRGETVRWEVRSPKDRRWYNIVNTPVRHRNGTISKMSLIQDITDRKRSENVLLARLGLVEYSASHSLDELLQATLDEVEVLTDSSIGFYHFIEPDRRTLSLQAWSTRTLRQMCTAEGKGLHYDLDKAGVWADCVRARRPVVHNDYAALPHRKDLPVGHADVVRELVVPVLRGDRIVAILGVGNKPVDYDASDIETVSVFADLAWDIAERKQVEEQLRESEERFRCMFERSLDAVFLTAPDGRIFKANPAACRMFGRSEEEICQLGRSGLVDTNDPAYNIFLEERRRTGSWKGELNHKRRDGTIFPAELSSAIFLKASGEERTTVVVRDITERKQIEEALRQARDGLERRVDERTAELSSANKQLMQEIIDRNRAEDALDRSNREWERTFTAISDLVMVLDQQHRILRANKAMADALGMTEQELTGKRCFELVHGEKAPPVSCPHSQLLADGDEHSAEVAEPSLGGIYDVRVSPLVGQNGQVTGSVHVIRDVTERRRAEESLRRSEELFRAIFESAQDLIFIKDLAGRYVKVNPAVERAFGLPASEIIGLKAEDLVDRRSSEAIIACESRILTGETVEEERTMTVKGAPFVFHSIGVPLKDPDGTIIGTCSIYRDITERRMAGTSPQVSSQGYRSKPMLATLNAIGHAAASDVIVLLQGESGSGKDHAARRIHDFSNRSGGPFFSINCAALPHELAESELFGHEAGAFTGAVKRKKGLLELAEGGTLLLNEIGELSLSLQAKLLSFLDTKSFLRVGGEKSITVNARLMAATHRDLEVEVNEGRFLRPLYYRLSVFSIHIPPLRKRMEDIPSIAKQLMASLAREMQLSEIPMIEPADLRALQRYHWPGNIRELRNVLERALIVSGRGPFHVSLPVLEQAGDWSHTVRLVSGQTLRDVTDEVTQGLCMEALRVCEGSKTAAARMLGISRDSMYRHLKRLGLASESQTLD